MPEPTTEPDPSLVLWLTGELTRLARITEPPAEVAEHLVRHLTAAGRIRDPLDAVTLWRCTACGKWSHAKRRPKRHQRYVVTGTTTVEYQEAETGAWLDDEVPDGDFVPCGPFAAWTATPDLTTSLPRHEGAAR